MYSIQTFNNPLFGDLRTIIINEKEYFFGIDIATDLMYKRPRKAVIDHCKGVLNQDGSVLTQDGEPIIPEGDVYRLIIKAGQQGNSKEIKEKADELEKWIFDDILPILRKTGTYGQPQLPQSNMELLELHYQALKEVDTKVDTVSEEVQSVKKELKEFKETLPLLPEDSDEISDLVKKRGVEILGGKQSSAYNDKCLRMKLYVNFYSNLKHNFNVRTYKAIKRNQKAKAIEVIQRYEPPFFLA